MAKSYFLHFQFKASCENFLKPFKCHIYHFESMCYALSMKLSVFPNSQMPETTKLRECKTKQLSWHLRCSYLLFPSRASFIQTMLHTPRAKKTEVAYYAACSILLIRAKKITSCIAMQSHPFPWVSIIQTVDVLQTKLSQTSFSE